MPRFQCTAALPSCIGKRLWQAPAGDRYTIMNTRQPQVLVRTLLITYGIAIVSYLFTRTMPAGAPPASGMPVPAQGLVQFGLGLQIALLVAGALLRRRAPANAARLQLLPVLELLGDGLTVLVFALGTYGAILNSAAAI